MKINVTLKDILFGIRTSRENCPISLAVRRTIPDKYIATNVDNIDISYASISLPQRAVKFIDAFDNKQFFNPAILPFSFELNFTEESK